MKFCQQCGSKMEDADVFCQACGAKSAVVAGAPIYPYPNAQAMNVPYPYIKKRVNPLAIIIPVVSVLVIGAVLLIVLLSGGGNTPSSVVQRYLDASKRGDIQGAIKCLTPETQALTDTLMSAFGDLAGQDLSGMLDEFGIPQDELNAGGVSFDYKIINEEIDGERASVYVEFHLNGDTEKNVIQCRKVDGSWYIEAF